VIDVGKPGNPIYFGMIEFKQELFEGIHEPLISKAVFDAVAEVVSAKTKPKSDKRKPYPHTLPRSGEPLIC
jgi:hypothetical protein